MAIYQDIFIDIGSDMEAVFALDRIPALDLINYTIVGELRRCINSETSTVFTFTTDVGLNKFSAILAHVQTSMLESGRFIYDIEFRHNSNDTRVKAFYGLAHITSTATQI